MLRLALFPFLILLLGCPVRVKIPRPGQSTLPVPPPPSQAPGVVNIAFQADLSAAVNVFDQAVPREDVKEQD